MSDQSVIDPITDLADEYLVRLSKGDVPVPDQGMAAALLGQRIKTLEDTIAALRRLLMPKMADYS